MNLDRSPGMPDQNRHAQPDWQIEAALWPPSMAQRWRAVVAHDDSGALCLVSDQAIDRGLLQLAEHRARRPVRWHRCDTATVDALLNAAQQGARALDAIDQDGVAAEGEALEDLDVLLANSADSPVVQLLAATLHDAARDDASDIHIECNAHGAELRFRVDGVMASVRQVQGRAVAEQLVSRLKVMAQLDIGERRLPQDGGFRMRVQGRSADFRLSVMPSTFGEDAVIRLLDRGRASGAGGPPQLDTLGFDPAQRSALRELAAQPHGLLLITGPTGSGKTTTLYAALGEIRTGREKIITIEDPVEMDLPGVVQIPVNDRKGLSFARGLRSILRHDPDRIMVGEIRDAETAQIAVQAALTGHLVLSSVHANNPYDVISRLTHMGLDLYHVVAALNAVMSQRLLRMVCQACAEPIPPPADWIREAGNAHTEAVFKVGRGCPACRGTGYKGRRAVAELLRLDDEIRDLIASRAPLARIKAAARAKGVPSLRQNALTWVAAGLTTMEEVHRVTLAD